MTDGKRPQDEGRRHRRRGEPSPETSSLLAEYQAAMRDELRAVLAELKGYVKTPDPGLGMIEVAPETIRPSLTDRTRLWDLGIKIGRELGTAVDVAPVGPVAAGRPRRLARGRIDYGPDA